MIFYQYLLLSPLNLNKVIYPVYLINVIQLNAPEKYQVATLPRLQRFHRIWILAPRLNFHLPHLPTVL